MPILFRCSDCNTLNKVADDLAGKAVRCGKCQAVQTVPVGGAPVEPEPPPAPAAVEEAPRETPRQSEKARRREDDKDAADEPRRRRRRKDREDAEEDEGQDLPRPRNLLKARQRKKSRVGLIVALVSVGLLGVCGLCAGVGWYAYSKVVGDTVFDGGGPEAKTLPPLEDIRDGKFTRPPRSTAPTSYFRMASSKGDFIGQGKSYSYSDNEVTVRGSANHLIIDAGPWDADFYGADTQLLKPGEYPNARRTSVGAPGIDVHGDGRGCNQTAGKFIVWELATAGGQVVRLAIDFEQRCEGKGPPLYGRIRFNSTFQ